MNPLALVIIAGLTGLAVWRVARNYTSSAGIDGASAQFEQVIVFDRG